MIFLNDAIGTCDFEGGGTLKKKMYKSYHFTRCYFLFFYLLVSQHKEVKKKKKLFLIFLNAKPK